jgi:uracil-DNA glycosylase family 4
VAREKRRRFQDEEYWGRPVPSFGDPRAKLLIVGLAPGAHGSNRTGRMFTGDRSGEFLYRVLYDAGFANQPESCSADDGLKLRGCYITAVVRCAPPQNKPRPQELRNCQPYLERELALLNRVRAVLALGRIAFDTYLRIVSQRCAGHSAGLSALAERGQPGIPQTTSKTKDPAAALAESRRPFAQRGGGAAADQPAFTETLQPRAGLAGIHSAGQCGSEPGVFPPRASLRFAHGASYQLPGGLPRLFASYHPSQQNTQTGRLTPKMFRQVLEDIRKFLAAGNPR